MKFSLRSALVVLAVAQILTASDKSDQAADSIRTLEQAVAKTNIFELPSFVLKANVQVEMVGKPFNGTYELFWNGPEHWREQLNLGDYHELQIGGKGVISVQRNTDYIPLAVFNVHKALGFGSTAGAPTLVSLVSLDLTSKDAVSKPRERTRHGEKLTCIEIETETKSKREMCVRESTGMIDRGAFQIADSDVQPIGTKVFPRELKFLDDTKTGAKMTITEFTSGSQFPPNAFAAPTGVSQQAGCMTSVLPHLVKKQNPQYPEAARQRRIQGTVAVHVTIGVDGVPSIRKVVESPSSELEASSLAAIKEWRYEPALCENRPVPMDTLLQVNYTLQQF